jgi:two-component system cell cycle sensor histidine kinase/response regulator CckA
VTLSAYRTTAGTIAIAAAGAAGAGYAAGMEAGMAAGATGLLAALLAAWRDHDARRVQQDADRGSAVSELGGDAGLMMAPDGRILAARGGIGGIASADLLARIDDGGAEDAARKTIAGLKSDAAAGSTGAAMISLRGRDDSLLQVSVEVSPGADGNLLWRFSDRTELEAARAATAGEARRAVDFLDGLPAGIFVAGEGGRMLFSNQVMNGWLGDGEILQAGRATLQHFVFRDPEGLFDPGAWSGETERRGRVSFAMEEHSPFDASVIVNRFELGGDAAPLYRVLVLKESSETEELSMALALAEARVDSFFRRSPIGIAELTSAGEIEAANNAFARLVRLDPEKLADRPLASFVAADDREQLNARLSKMLMGAARGAEFEARLIGEEDRTAIFRIGPRFDSDGGTIGMVAHVMDATEQKNLEVQFAQAQKMQSMGQLAGGVAHDFNNLLTAMIGFCDLLLQRHSAGDPSFADIMQIKQNANRAANLVRQLLAFSRKQKMEPKIVDVAESLSELSNLLRRLIGDHVQLDIGSESENALVRVDPGQLDQVIINLVVNARDAMPEGGEVSVHSSSVSYDRQVRRGGDAIPPGDYIRIEVADNGSGIAPENLSRIFEPFFSTKDVGAGTGLGLSTVYGIIRQTGGYIFVESEIGKGTTFTILLPVYGDEGSKPTVRRRQMPEVTDLTGKGNVLLVEDEDAVRMFGARALRNKGYTVLEATSGEGALEVINNAKMEIDIIVSDVMMPGMDGPTLVRLIREDRPQVKVILISGYSEETIRGDFDGDDQVHFLPKPFSLNELATKVKEVITAA